MTARAAITGVGYTPFTRDSGTSVLDLAAQACQAAIDDAGLDRDEVDGVASFMVMHDSVPCQAVATVLALPEQRLLLDVDLGGQGPCYLVSLAAAAVNAGIAKNVVVFRAMNGRSGNRVGTMQFAGMGAQYRYPLGYDAYMMYVAMWGQRFLHETGGGPEDLGAVAVAQRRYAERNPRAVRRPGLDIGDHLLAEDYTRNYTSSLAAELFGRAGLSPGDVQVAEIYDCFSSTVLIGLEGLGICGRGEAGGFVRSGATALDGALPVNTHGGLLAEGYLHGMNTVAEAALQVQGRGGDRQAPRHDVCAVTSGALMDGSALLLTADR
jgi:acetyl-CoA acetyltransferase